MDTLVSTFEKVFSSNATDDPFPSRVSTTTQPASAGVIESRKFGEFTNGSLLFVPYGTGADDSTLDLRIIGWRQIDTLWVPVILCQVQCTLSTAVGVSGAAVTNSERFADTITLTSPFGTSGVDVNVSSPANNTPGHILIDPKGCPLIEVTVDLGTATAANALVARV